MQATEWLSLCLRWLHIIAGAAWIGTSFYFNWLNNNVRPLEEPEERVKGDLWSIHGGHFYRVVKYTVAPEKLPKTLHWFKWEAYTTWISGFALLIVVYYVDANLYLIDPTVHALSAPEAIGIGLGTLLIGWIVYDLLCKSPLIEYPVPFAIVAFALATAAAWALTDLFGSRAAYIHMGALIGTLMAGNVFHVIIPKQRKSVAEMSAGKDPDPKLGIDAARRSLHNNYMTLPVLFIMVSNHYPFTYGHEWNWAVLAAISLIGAGVRHWFNLRGLGRKNAWILPSAAVGIVALALVSAPRDELSSMPEVAFDDVRTIVEQRCLSCHSATPTQAGIDVAPQGVMFDNPDQIVALAPRIHNVVYVSKTMPLGNLTAMSDEERKTIGAWFTQGARR